MADERNPFHHTRRIKAMMRDLIEHLRSDVEKVEEPQTKALFETTAEALGGLITAFEDYESKNEPAWQGQREHHPVGG